MLFLASHGHLCVAHDRRGHGRSSQPWNGNEMNTYADDLAALVDALGLRDAIHVGHSTGGGEVARYIGRHGTRRVTRAVPISAVPPLMLRTAANPPGLPMEVFDDLRRKAFSETDFTDDLKKFEVPTLILHGDDDQIVPIGASAQLSSRLVKNAALKVYPGAPHGMCSTLKEQINADLLAFLRG
jgi:non-heme chloroperoxidase